MSFPKYPAYKDSGVEWLGVVPEHWTVTLLKRGYEVVLGKMLQPEAKRDDDELLPYLRAANIQPFGIDVTDVKKMWFGVEEKKSLLLRRGDLLVSEGGDVGRSAIWDMEGEYYFQNSINRIRSIVGNDTRFLYFWMTDIKSKGYIDVLCNKSTIAHFTAEKVATVPLLLPSKIEQTQIARFLDHETARIDALIEEQQRLIELLKEKRQAVISHAVTKGLDPTVPMKDSGVEWLGEVPAHWMIKKIKHVMKSLDQGWSPQCDNFPVTGEEKGVLKVGCVNGGVFNSAENKRLPGGLEFYPDLTIKEGDLLISRANTRELVGSAAVPSIDYPNLMISDKLYRIRFYREQADPRFVCFYLATSFARREIELSATGASASMLNIAQNTILDMPFPCPPISEQEQIRDHIVSETYKILELVKSAQILVELLLERRSALISAAVTGKIDVRNWQPTASAQAPEAEQEAV